MSIRVLVVDDSATVRYKIKSLLEKHGLEVEQAGNVSEALGKLGPGHVVDVVITDLRMPGLDGQKLVDSIGRCDELTAVPVVVLTSSEEKDDRLRNIESGAAAYFNKANLDEDVFVAQIRNLAKKKASTVTLQRDSRTDTLTGLSNRRYGDERMAQELEKLGRYGHSFAVALLDIDHFKKINDSLGHKAGDEVLRHLAVLLRRASRTSDLVVRWGGEEFLVVFPGTDAEQAAGIVERLRATLAETPITLEGGGAPVPVTISGGVAEAQKGDTAETLVQRADKGLYRAKETGRNRLLQWKAGELVPVAAA